MKTWDRGYRRNWAAVRPSSVLFPEPVFPSTRAWPTSESCRLTRKGVALAEAAHRSGGLPGGKRGDGLTASPGQILVIGRRSATLRVCSRGRRRLGYP